MNSANPRSGTGAARIAIIAAVAANGVIGRNGTLPWHLPEDLKHFKALTTGKRIVMGRRTWESFPKPLPNREHVVVSSSTLTLPEGVYQTRTLAEAVALPHPSDPIFIIGGTRLYEEALAIADDLYLTKIDANVEGDTMFPNFSRSTFSEVSRESHSAPLAANSTPTRFHWVHYERR
jgi:dihydrofolate reductase